VRIPWRRPAGAGPSEDFAWACLVANLAGVPGLGTLMAREWTAVPQLALAIVAGVCLTWWLVAFGAGVLRTGELPPPDGPPFALLVWGTVLFAAAWLWALATSLALLRAAQRAAGAPVHGSLISSSPPRQAEGERPPDLPGDRRGGRP